MAMDYGKLAITEIGNMSERRTARLVDASSNGGVLPMFLTRNGGLESGFMMAQYTAAALASETRSSLTRRAPTVYPASANTEDHVSMGATAVRQLATILDHVETIVAIELLCAAQGIDLRREDAKQALEMGVGTRKAFEIIRQKVPFITNDMPLAPLIEIIRGKVASGRIKREVEAELGE
jgi:histidine ammonia-lyase